MNKNRPLSATETATAALARVTAVVVLLLLFLLLLASGTPAFAQQSRKESSGAGAPRRSDPLTLSPDTPITSPIRTPPRRLPAIAEELDADTKPEEKKRESRPPTEITSSKEASFDDKTRMAVFLGEVQVRDAQFTITCDKLTAYLRKEATQGGAGKSEATPAAGNEKGKKSSGLERAIAEGNVVIMQETTGEDGKTQRNIGRCQRAEYNANTGDVTLSGRPQVQQGINMQVATDDSTVMIMNRDGRTMRTIGPSKTVIQESQPGDKKTSLR